MSSSEKHTQEKDFESTIEAYLLEHAGYTKAENTQFDAELALDKDTLLAFLRATQKDAYDKLQSSYGVGADEKIVKRIASQCDDRGLLDVLRKGVSDRGQHFKLAYFRPPTGLNPETEKLYAENRLTVMRQVYYDPDSKKSIDMLLSLNGLPIATAELKNAMTSQTVTNAIWQYKHDRESSPKTKLLQFKKRALVHFAVDTDDVYMATRLAGKGTYFLPFNTGCDGGRGNPTTHSYSTGYKTGYLWEVVWAKDSWMDILHRFIHLQVEESVNPDTKKKKRKETLIFPRFHQLDATRKLLSATRINGVGENYLIQHSAGSGKTNTISWTAHQLASLHDSNDKPIFNTVVVVSDRRNLDKQLQDNIYQMEHKKGVVAKIDEDKKSSDLADELNQGTKIIITTLQKFSFLMDKVDDFKDRNFAVIVDEAHSSQSGKSASNLKVVLGTQGKDVLEAAEAEDGKEPEAPTLEDLIVAEAKSRGRQPNLSFYAFTATPKAKTLEMFGKIGEDGKPHPFHLYSMRQAIEEGFILDVLRNYTTYKTFYNLAKAIEDDPSVDEKKAKKAIARYMRLHPHNLAQKTEIMVEHYRQKVKHLIGGKAKAMVVTRSRLHAVRYKLAFDKYLQENNYNDIQALVAFSGTVNDPDMPNVAYTEPTMNGFSEKELPMRFGSSEYHVLIVAEKYQTGFDQPLLHTMYVDKRLMGLKAVQTLSRLNRTREGKDSTFILDFANDVEEIREAFKPYYEKTEIEEVTDPNHLYSIRTKILGFPIIRIEDIHEFAKVFFKPHKTGSFQDHGQMNKWIDPCVDRFKKTYRDPKAPAGIDRYTEEGEDFKSTLQSYVRLYGFLSQVMNFTDKDLEMLYPYARYLFDKLPKQSNEGVLNLDGDVALTHYRNDLTYEGSGALTTDDVTELRGGGKGGTGFVKDEHLEPLSHVIQVINEKFGTDWTDEDKVLFEQISKDMATDEKLVAHARANTKDQFKEVFYPEVMRAFAMRQNRNDEIVGKFMSDEGIRKLVMKAMLDEFFDRAQGE